MSDAINPGQVTITLDGDEVTLVPTGRALLTLSRAHGGLLGVNQAISRFDLDAFVSVIAAGVPDLTESQKKALPDLIFAAGIVKLFKPISRFVNNLSNGGKPDDEDGDAKEGGEGNG